jgi:hypothetical protein
MQDLVSRRIIVTAIRFAVKVEAVVSYTVTSAFNNIIKGLHLDISCTLIIIIIIVKFSDL